MEGGGNHPWATESYAATTKQPAAARCIHSRQGFPLTGADAGRRSGGRAASGHVFRPQETLHAGVGDPTGYAMLLPCQRMVYCALLAGRDQRVLACVLEVQHDDGWTHLCLG